MTNEIKHVNDFSGTWHYTMKWDENTPYPNENVMASDCFQSAVNDLIHGVKNEHEVALIDSVWSEDGDAVYLKFENEGEAALYLERGMDGEFTVYTGADGFETYAFVEGEALDTFDEV